MSGDRLVDSYVCLTALELKMCLGVLAERIETYEEMSGTEEWVKALEQLQRQLEEFSSTDWDADWDGYMSYEDSDEDPDSLGVGQILIFACIEPTQAFINKLEIDLEPEKWKCITAPQYYELKRIALNDYEQSIYAFATQDATVITIDTSMQNIAEIRENYPYLNEALDEFLYVKEKSF